MRGQMQKPWAPANDLADHDIVEDDSDLVVGPLAARLSIGSAGGKQLGSSSFKDTSILGSVALTSKLAQCGSAPSPPALSRGTSFKQNSNCVYYGGNPIIATASPSSRPTSAAPRPATPSNALLQARASAPAGEIGPTAEASVPKSKSVHAGQTFGTSNAAGGVASALSRIEGDIQGGGSSDSSAPRAGPLLWRRDSIRVATPCAKPPAMKPVGGEGRASLSRSDSQKGGAGAPPDTAGCSNNSSSRPPSCDGGVSGRGAALPSVDMGAERGQRLLRNPSMSGAQAAVVTSQPKLSSSGAAHQAPAQEGCPGGLDLQPQAFPRDMAPQTPASEVMDKEKPSTAEAQRRRSSSGRFLTRLLSGSMVAPTATEDQHEGLGAASKECSSGGASGSNNVGGLWNLFSRPSSAKRKSDAGVSPPQLWQLQEPLMQAQPQQQPQPQGTGLLGRQPRHSLHGHMENAAACEGGRESLRRSSIGGGRPPSGILKRTASAIASAWAR